MLLTKLFNGRALVLTRRPWGRGWFVASLRCLPFDRKIRLGCRNHNGKRFTRLSKSPSSDSSSLEVGRFAAKKGSLRSPRGRLVASLAIYQFTSELPQKGLICVAWVWNRQGLTEKLVNDKQHSVWFDTNRNERTTSKCTLQFSVGISEKWSYHLPSRLWVVPIFPQR